MSDRGIDRVFGYIALDARNCRCARACSSGSGPRCTFILWAVCHVRMITSPTRPMAWLSDDIMESAPMIVENVFRRDGFLADAAFRKSQILRDRRIKMVTNHEHVEMLIERC